MINNALEVIIDQFFKKNFNFKSPNSVELSFRVARSFAIKNKIIKITTKMLKSLQKKVQSLMTKGSGT